MKRILIFGFLIVGFLGGYFIPRVCGATAEKTYIFYFINRANPPGIMGSWATNDLSTIYASIAAQAAIDPPAVGVSVQIVSSGKYYAMPQNGILSLKAYPGGTMIVFFNSHIEFVENLPGTDANLAYIYVLANLEGPKVQKVQATTQAMDELNQGQNEILDNNDGGCERCVSYHPTFP